MMSGGVMPGGKARSSVWLMAVSWATPASGSEPGWKNTLISPKPFRLWLSWCSTLFTVVVMARSTGTMMRWFISSGEMPE